MAEPSESAILAHGEALERLRPPGLVWTSDASSVSRQLYTALGAELARVTGRAADLVREADPRTSVELLEDWERVLGLPGPCGTLEPTVVLRQFAVHAKLSGSVLRLFVTIAGSPRACTEAPGNRGGASP